MQIKQAAARCGLTEKAIRLYEEKGLITPTYTEKNGRQFRDYDEETVARLQTIAALRKSFFSIEQIAAVLDTPENIPAVFASYRAELQKQYADLKPLIARAEEIDARNLTTAADVSAAMTAPALAPHGISDEALPSVHFRVWDEGASTDEREQAYARYQKWIVRWEKRYAVELAVRGFVSCTWKWVVFAILPLGLAAWCVCTLPIVSNVTLTLSGYEITSTADMFGEISAAFDVTAKTTDAEIAAFDVAPYARKAAAAGTERTLTLRGTFYNYLFREDCFRGEVLIDSYEIHERYWYDGPRDPETLRRLVGDQFRLTFGPWFSKYHTAMLAIEDTLDGELKRDTDNSSIDHFYWYGDIGAPTVIALPQIPMEDGLYYLHQSSDQILVFPADSPEDAFLTYLDTKYRQDRKTYRDDLINMEQQMTKANPVGKE